MASKWNIQKIDAAIKSYSEFDGRMPTRRELEIRGRGDLAQAIRRHGGYGVVAERIGRPPYGAATYRERKGAAGESIFAELMAEHDIRVEQAPFRQCPYDAMVDGVLRIEIKSATYQEYGPCKGWFYALGRRCGADCVALVQLDTRDLYVLPYWVCPSTNITIARDGGKYAQYRNNISLIRQMIDVRKSERKAI
jgi:hypothetical protein